MLKPRTKEVARSRSLSALHGLDAQPLHTDGAHLSIPPRVIALVSEVASTTPTRLKKLEKPDFWGYPKFLRDGVFLVRNHPNSFLCTAAIMKGRLVAGIRFDPGCMEACDARAREAAEFFGEQSKGPLHEHNWGRNEILLINNWEVLHGRASVAETESGRRLHRIAFSEGGM